MSLAASTPTPRAGLWLGRHLLVDLGRDAEWVWISAIDPAQDKISLHRDAPVLSGAPDYIVSLAELAEALL